MTHHDRIAKSFSDGGINRVLVIDDAFDAPNMDDQLADPLLGFLRDSASVTLLGQLGVDTAHVSAALDALGKEEFDDEGLIELRDRLYAEFSKDHDSKFDPGGRFSTIKGEALNILSPLGALLNLSNGIEVRNIGLAGAYEAFEEFDPQVIFLDFYLSSEVNEGTGSDSAKAVAARRESVDLLKRLTNREPGAVPAVVLMSSKEVGAEKDRFRREAQPTGGSPRIVSWRFQFLHKPTIARPDGQFVISTEAADALLETSQAHRFGSELHKALHVWETGLRTSVGKLITDISDLEIKDFAYLLRFRLQEEGQPFSEYLHWLFGESLLDAVGSDVDWGHEAFRRLDDTTSKVSDSIEGAYDGATVGIARMFDKARIDRRGRPNQAARRLGDIYRIGDSANVRAVITPDCDLVVRPKGGAKVKKPLTIGGILHRYDAPTTSLADFIIIEKVPFSIQWNPKDLETIDFGTEFEAGRELVFMGTLRPLYAQELQRSVLTDLSRVGVPVPPVIGLTASAELHVGMKPADGQNGASYISVGDLPPGRAWCTLMPSRVSGRKPRYVFHREFVHRIFEALRNVPEDKVHTDGKGRLMDAASDDKRELFYKKFCRDGVELGSSVLGIVVVGDGKEDAGKNAWARIIVRRVSEEAGVEAD